MTTLSDSETCSFYPSWESDFREKASAAAGNIKKIEENAEELSIQLIRRPLKSSKQVPPEVKEAADQEEQKLQKETTTLAQETKVLMHEMRRYLTENKDNRAARIQFDRLADNFASALHEFQQYQRDLVTRERTKCSAPTAEDLQVEQTMGSGDAVDPNDPEAQAACVQTQKLINLDQQTLAIELDAMNDRQNAVESLEQEIRDVNDIFRDLALLVHEQGDVIDSIEASIETGDLNLTSGLDELERARRKANRRRARKMMCYGVACIFVVLLVLSVVFGSMA